MILLCFTYIVILLFSSGSCINYYSPRCPNGWSPRSGSIFCYKFNDNTQMSWNDASSYCQSLGASLVTVHSKDEKVFLSEHPQRSAYSIGLHGPISDGSQTWQWVDNTTWTLSDAGIISWNPGEPNNSGGDEHCVEITTKSGKMNDIPCNNKESNFICKRSIKSLTYCPSYYTQVFDQCFHAYSYRVTQARALVYCRIFGGSLMVVTNANEAQFIMDELTRLHMSAAWINLKKKKGATSFQWFNMAGHNVTGVDPSPYWGIGEPKTPSTTTDYCVQVKTSDMKWHAVSCNYVTGFFILKPKLNCAVGWTEINGKCVQFNRDSASYIPWQDSHDLCSQQNSTLLQVDSDTKTNAVDKYVYSSTWMDLTDVWKSDGAQHFNQFKWYESGVDASKGYTNWYNNKTGSGAVASHKNCVYFDGLYKHKGKWSAYDCKNRRYFTCEANINDTVVPIGRFEDYYCDAGWTNFGSFCYWFHTDAQSWPSAVQTCAVNMSSLVSVIHADEASFLDGTSTTEFYWTGLNDQKSENRYVWQDNKVKDGIALGLYKNWDVGQPNDLGAGESNCAKTHVKLDGSAVRVGKWDDDKCSMEYPFVCKKKGYNKNTRPPLPSRTTPWPSQCGPYWKYETISGNCYRASETLNSWADAEAICQSYGGNLASIHSIAEATSVAVYTREFYKGKMQIWIGANDRATEGGWKWSDNSAMSYLNWSPGEPNNAGGGGWFPTAGEDCVQVYSDTLKWNDNDCGQRRNYLCKKWGGGDTTPVPGVTSPAPPGPGYHWDCLAGWASFGSYCYKLGLSPVTRPNALKACRKLGADLASIHSKTENEFVLSMTQKTEPWLGLADLKMEGLFQWSDTTVVDYTSWNSLEPNDYDNREDCIQLYKNGGWNDIDCSKVLEYMCKMVKSMQPPNTGPPTDSGCPPYYVGYQDSCYHFVTSPATFTNAKASCIRAGGHLVDISSLYEESFLTSQLASKSSQFLVGLKENPVNGQYSWSDGSAVEKTYWDLKYPDDKKGSCVAVTSGKVAGLWQNVQCTSPMQYICETGKNGKTQTIITTTQIPPSERCGDPSWERFQSKCYKSFSMDKNGNQLSWEEARAFCRGFGADLAAIPNMATNQFIQENMTMGSRDGNQYWIGLNSLGGSEQWSDATPITFTAWGNKQPDHGSHGENHCVTFIPSTGGKWFETHCAITHNWICSASVGSALKTTTTGPPPTNPSQFCPSIPEAGGYPWIYANKTCYWASGRSWNSLMTWQGAQKYCNKLSAKLMSIHTQQEEDLLIGLLQKLPYYWSTYWLGLSQLTLDGSMRWSDGSALDYTYWNPGEPNSAGFAGEACIETYVNGRWNDDHCSTLHPFVCAKDTRPNTPTPPPHVVKGNCPQGWFKADNMCYKFFHDQTANWTYARQICQSQGVKGDLASIKDSNANLVLTANMGESYASHTPYTEPYWIGLTDHSAERRFLWTDNSELTFTNWDAGEPNNANNEDCVSMFVSVTPGVVSKWNDAQCTNYNRFVCQMNPDPTLPTPKPQLHCAQNYTANYNSCYKLTSAVGDWDTVESECYDGASVHLASIINPFEEAFLRVLVNSEKDMLWIGMNDRDANTVYEWADSWPVLYSRWGKGEPTSLGGEGCVTIDKNGFWNDVQCNQTHKGICKYTSATKPTASPYAWCNSYRSCPPTKNGVHWLDGGDCYCYYAAIESEMTQSEGLRQCVQLDANLVSIENAGENKFILDYILPYIHVSPWLGLLKSKASEGFFWTNGDAVRYVNWAPNQPNNYNNEQDCAEMYGNGQWNDLSCMSKLNPICKIFKVTKPTPSWAPEGICFNDPNWTLFNGNCYYVSSYWRDGQVSWSSAEQKCNAMGGAHLTSVHSKDEMKFIQNYADHQSGNWFYWIGLSQTGSETGEFTWTDNSVVDFEYWDQGEPNDAQTGQDCVGMYDSDGKWDDNHCGKKYSFICERPYSNGSTTASPPITRAPVIGGCPDEWVTYSLSNKCYRFFGLGADKSELKDYNDAMQFCRSYGRRADLVSIHNDVENAFLTYHGANKSNAKLWIGLSDSESEYRFLWSDQTSTDFVNWDAGEPNDWKIGDDEDCVEMYSADSGSTGRWNDKKCSGVQNGYICEQKRNPSLSPPIVPSTPSCPSGFQFQGSCYFATEKAQTWNDANDYCNRMNGALTSVVDAHEQAYIYVMIHQLNLGYGVWIGLHRTANLFAWVDNWPVKYTNWANKQPSEKPLEKCVHMSERHSGVWDDATCGAEYYGICKTTTKSPPVYPSSFPGVCPTSKTAKYPYKDAGTRTCYQLITDQKVSFGDANMACIKDGASLASFHEQGDIDFVTGELHYVGHTNVWIGLLRQTDGSFSWTDKSPVDITNWASGEPNNYDHGEDCVQVYPGGQWNDISCDGYGSTGGYICSKSKIAVTSTVVNVPTSAILPSVSKPIGPNEVITPMTGLPDVGVAGIVVGVLVGLILVGVVVLMFLKRDSPSPSSSIKRIDVPPSPSTSNPVDTGFDNALYENKDEQAD